MAATQPLTASELLLAETCNLQLGNALFTNPSFLIAYARHLVTQRKTPGFTSITPAIAAASLARLQGQFPLFGASAGTGHATNRRSVNTDEQLASGASQRHWAKRKVRLAAAVNAAANNNDLDPMQVDSGARYTSDGFDSAMYDDGPYDAMPPAGRDPFKEYRTENNAIHPLAVGMTTVVPSEIAVADVLSVLAIRLAKVLEAQSSDALPAATGISAESATQTLLQEVVGHETRLDLETVAEFVPDVVAHIYELETGPTRFDIIVLDALATSSGIGHGSVSQEDVTYVNMWNQSFMAIPIHLVHASRALMYAFKEARTNKSLLWQNCDRIGTGDILASCTKFMHMDSLRDWYDKDLWELVYIRQLCVCCEGATSYDELCLFREWLYQVLHLIAVARGLAPKVYKISDRPINPQFAMYSPGSTEIPDGPMATAEFFVNWMDGSGLLPYQVFAVDVDGDAVIPQPTPSRPKHIAYREMLEREQETLFALGALRQEWGKAVQKCERFISSRCVHVKRHQAQKYSALIHQLHRVLRQPIDTDAV